MRILTFNVNGIRSLHSKSKKGEKGCAEEGNCLNTLIQEQSPDILCLQEIRCQNTKELEKYQGTHPYLYTNHSAAKAGYSGTAILSRTKPIQVFKDFLAYPDAVPTADRERDLFREGRMLTAEFDTVFVICVYTPNAKEKLARIDERLLWDTCFQTYIQHLLNKGKEVIVCGDLNCAHNEIDIFDPKNHKASAGFSDAERNSFSRLLREARLSDSYRLLHPQEVKYTFWSNFFKSREKGRGWRIDYILVSSGLLDKLSFADCLNEYFGSDHCPVLTELSL